MPSIKSSILSINIPQKAPISYPIYIGQKILKQSGELIKKNINSQKLLLVSNDTVYPIYGKLVCDSLTRNGFEVKTVVIPDGEDYKNINWLKVMLDKAIDFKLERKDAIVALGGGVIGDMSGFAAASYLRGINLIQIPTTLLAHVDSSIGGKVAINHAKGKNLIGAFYQPKCVLIDPSTLETLDKRNFKNGLGEVLKYAFIEKSCNLNNNSLNFFNFLQENLDKIYNLDQDIISQTIMHCCKLKAAVVEQDEKEAGLRAILNLGHTTGHALELCGNYQDLSHGEGVSIGTIVAFNLAKENGYINDTILMDAINLIKSYNLPITIPANIRIEDIIKATKRDKKVSSGKLRFVLPCKEPGMVDIYDDIKQETIEKVLKKCY